MFIDEVEGVNRRITDEAVVIMAGSLNDFIRFIDQGFKGLRGLYTERCYFEH